ncbi:MAG: DNA-3-methyladenine glycosylase 2 family protein [Actinobacteria bacterium]|nr:MAG: DNA-3-methyladenine glycosylase 2 family protein [Actinomycetota bacterium]
MVPAYRLFPMGSPTTRASVLLAAATEELAWREPAIADLAATVGVPNFRRGRPRRPHFAELARMICYQQLAGSAARAIHGRFEALFDGPATAEGVLSLPDERLRSAGLSASKARSIQDLARHVVDRDVRLNVIARLPDEEVIRELTLVRGIGTWTAHMFLIFQLGRLDVWPVDDYGVRKGYARLFGNGNVASARELQPLGDRFRPYRSVAAWYCWRAADTLI